MKTFSQFISEVTLGKGEHYGRPEYQKRLYDERAKQEEENRKNRTSDANQAREDLKAGFMRGSKGGRKGKFYKDAVTGKYTVFKPD